LHPVHVYRAAISRQCRHRTISTLLQFGQRNRTAPWVLVICFLHEVQMVLFSIDQRI